MASSPTPLTAQALKTSRRPKESSRHVTAITTALRLLDCFQSDVGLQLKDLHHKTGINKSRILRFVGSLEAGGLLYFDEDWGRYVLGPKLYYLGRVIEKHYDDLIVLLRPVLHRLAAETGSVAYFSILRGCDRLVLLRIQPDGRAERIVKDGQVRPIQLGANGRVLLAFQPPQARQRVLARLQTTGCLQPGEALAAFEAQLDQTRQDSYAMAFGETKPSHFVISVPLFSLRRRLLGVLALSTPGSRADAEKAQGQLHLLQLAAAELGEALRNRPRPPRARLTPRQWAMDRAAPPKDDLD